MSLLSWIRYGRRTSTTAGREWYPEPKTGLIEKILKRLVPYYDIVGHDEAGENALYLRRFILSFNKRRGHLFLHHIYRSDSDRYPHSHPWAFNTIIISGGYTDEAYDVHWILGKPTRGAVEDGKLYRWPVVRSPEPRRTLARPGYIYRRPSSHVHLLKLHPGKTAWTLVRTAGAEQPWGFLTETEWIYWREYLQDWESDPG